jgi:acyl carrier protein
MTTYEKIAKILAQYRDMEVDGISPETKFEDLGLDSLDMVDLVMAMEDEFDIEIEVEENLFTVGDLVKLIDDIKLDNSKEDSEDEIKEQKLKEELFQ